jgi:hypothetical protein
MKNGEPFDPLYHATSHSQEGDRQELTHRTQGSDAGVRLRTERVGFNAEDLVTGSRGLRNSAAQGIDLDSPDAGIPTDRVPIFRMSTVEPFIVQGDFCDHAWKLRNQFDQKMRASQSADPAENPLTYVCSENEYQFISATTEYVFDAELVFHFLDTLREWARKNLGASHASTPRIQIYVGGSYRHLAKDDIKVLWHYFLCLTPDKSKMRPIKLSLESVSEGLNRDSLSVSTVTSITLKFNQLLVHDAARAYAIRQVRSSMWPADGMVFLDGYLW